MVVHRELGLPTAYTLEASFCGCDDRRRDRSIVERDAAEALETSGSGNCGNVGNSFGASTRAYEGGGGFHFSTAHLQQIGWRFCRALHVYFGLGAPREVTPSKVSPL